MADTFGIRSTLEYSVQGMTELLTICSRDIPPLGFYFARRFNSDGFANMWVGLFSCSIAMEKARTPSKGSQRNSQHDP